MMDAAELRIGVDAIRLPRFGGSVGGRAIDVRALCSGRGPVALDPGDAGRLPCAPIGGR